MPVKHLCISLNRKDFNRKSALYMIVVELKMRVYKFSWGGKRPEVQILSTRPFFTNKLRKISTPKKNSILR